MKPDKPTVKPLLRVYEVYEKFDGHIFKWVRLGEVGDYDLHSIKELKKGKDVK